MWLFENMKLRILKSIITSMVCACNGTTTHPVEKGLLMVTVTGTRHFVHHHYCIVVCCCCLFLYFLRLVFTSDGVGVGVVVGVIRELMTEWKSKIGVVSRVISSTESESEESERFHFFRFRLRLRRLWSSEN